MFKVTFRIALVLVCALVWNLSKAAEPVLRFSNRPVSQTAGSTGNGPVIYDQLLPLSFGSIVSHEMTDAGNAPMTSFAADDFIVPEGNNWNINYVNVAGSYNAYTGISIPSINVVFYADNNGMPGAALHTFNGLQSFNEIELDATMGVYLYEISLPEGVDLTPGHYWLGVQAVSDYTITGQWGWFTHESLPIDSEYHWKNPADGFGLGYTDWTTASLITWGSYNLAFSLSGPGLPGDIAATAVTEPVSASGLTSTEHISVRVKNEGPNNLTGVTLAYRINGGAPVTENASSLTIGPNQYAIYTFNTTANLSQAGLYEITAYTLNASDPNHSNDTTSTSVYNLGTVYPMVATGTQTITTCGATFTDSGGLEGNIGMYDDAVTTIYPANAGDRVRLTFIEFNASYGGFEIYNGTDMNAPLIGNYTGTDSPGEITAMNTGGALTIHFMGPGWEETSGWVAYMSCVTPLPDEFEMLSINGSLLTVFEGNTMTITASVRNIGTVSADKPVTFTVNGTTLSVVNTGLLAPFETADVTAEWTAPAPGNYIIAACLPADGDNTNNCIQMERNVLAFNAFFEDFENEPFPPVNWYQGGLWSRSNSSPASGFYHATSFFSNLQSDTLVSRRVDVGENPILTFYAKTSLWWLGNLDLYYYNEANSTWNFIMNAPLNVMNYGLITADLTAFTGTTGRIGFFVNVTDPNSWSGNVDLDVVTGTNITVHNDNLDLKSVAFTGSNFYTTSAPATFTMSIINNGLLPVEAGSYNVALFSGDGTQLASVAGNSIAQGEQQDYVLEYGFTTLSEIQVYGKIVFEQDQYQPNNTSHIILINGVADSSEIVVVGNNESMLEAPVIFGFKNSLSESLYTGEAIQREGVIFGIRYNFNFDGDETNIPVKIWLGTTTQTDLTTWVPAGDLTLVYDGKVNFTSEASTVYIPFQTPFNYSDTSLNLAIMVQKIDDHTSNNRNFYAFGTMSMSTLMAGSNSSVPDPYSPPGAGQADVNPYIQLVYNDNLGTASGNVHDVAALPIEDVKVFVGPLNITTYTDASGNYTIPYIPAGSFATSANKFGYEVVAHDLVINSGENTVLDFELPALAQVTVSGTIEGNDNPGTGIAGALVSLDGYSQYSTISNAQGEFEIDSVYVADNYQLTITANMYEVYNQSVNIPDNTALGTIMLTEAMEIARVVDAVVDSTSAQINWLEPSTLATGVFSTDDGINENGFAGEPGEYVWLGNQMQFNDPMTVTGFDLFWAKYSISQPHTHNLYIFDADGNHVYTSASFTSADNGWISVDIPDMHLQGKFYVMVLWDNTTVQANYLAIDTASAATPDNSYYHYEGGDFSLLSNLTGYSGSFLIHANVKFGDDTKNVNHAYDRISQKSRDIAGYKVTTGKLEDIDNAANWPIISDLLDVTSYTDDNWPPAVGSDYIYGVKTFYTTGESDFSFSNVLHYHPVNAGNIALPHIMTWPNPATRVIYVKADAGSQVELFNLQGQPVMNAQYDGSQFRFDVKDLSKGTYLVVVINNGSMSNEKVIVK
ncbi:MAG TPA: carboxypeptidase regulatory-like domain-containing protein [Lentimicrobium sp.]|nr:carboxypeptidase regulatory-like domain-containing protein [Lentimicrobium sp.]